MDVECKKLRIGGKNHIKWMETTKTIRYEQQQEIESDRESVNWEERNWSEERERKRLIRDLKSSIYLEQENQQSLSTFLRTLIFLFLFFPFIMYLARLEMSILRCSAVQRNRKKKRFFLFHILQQKFLLNESWCVSLVLVWCVICWFW